MRRKKNITLLSILFIIFSILPVHADDGYQLEVDLVSQYAYVVDLTNNEVLLDIQAEDKMYPASMTKMLTAIVAIENIDDLNTTITIEEKYIEGLAEEDASMAGFAVDDKPTVLDLLYGVALPSGADACNALAYYVAGDISKYVDMMNAKAQEIGMSNSHFENPTGLHDKNHYSTAYDMATLLTYCIKNETFRQIFGTRRYVTEPLDSNPDGLEFLSTVENALQIEKLPIPGFEGGKTGFTYPAGHCIAFWATGNDMDIVGVTAFADTDMWQITHIEDMSQILQELEHWQHKQLCKETDILHTITVHHRYEDQEIPIYTPTTIEMDLRDDYEIETIFNMPDEITSTNEGQILEANYSILINGETLYEKGLYVTVPREPNIFARFLNWVNQLFN